MKKKILIISLCICSLAAIILFLFYPHIKLNNNIIKVSVHTKLDELKYSAKNVFGDVTDKVKVDNNVNVDVVGEYLIEYNIKYLFLNIKKEEKVLVVDSEIPVITLTGLSEVTICPNTEYQDEGFTVTDNYDPNPIVISNQKENAIYYKATDSSGNSTEVKRTISIGDTESPTIVLSGSNTITLYAGSKYVEPGYSATDNCDGEITSKVIVDNKVNTNSVGSYKITYSVTDAYSNTTTIERNVKVINRQVTPINGVGNGIIYLTFDDGPSNSITPQILDILKEEGVKATFFVTGKSSSLDYLIKRAYDEGHTIALHSSSHNYSYIYSSIDNYFNDLNSIDNKVQSLIGINSKIIRFPGGSSNTVSRNYNYGIMSNLVNLVTEKGYIYFDWNVDCEDAGGAVNSNQVYNNVVNNLSHSKTNVVLMHDFENNYKTLNALRDIISYGKNSGYSFSSINESTPRVVHGVNN